MARSILVVVAAVAVAFGMAAARGDALGDAIDLTAFDRGTAAPASGFEDLPLEDVAYATGGGSRRFYVAGMIGPSFASVTSPVPGANDVVASSNTIFNAGGALGVALERRRGQLRLEVEGMGRGPYEGLEANGAVVTYLSDNWSVMTNGWRDLMLTDSVGIYGGGGIGAGGYTLAEGLIDGPILGTLDPTAAFAWQAGGGLLWLITDRLTFDAGYRYYSIDALQQRPGALANQFAASEVMFSLRLYEPFRAWRGGDR